MLELYNDVTVEAVVSNVGNILVGLDIDSVAGGSVVALALDAVDIITVSVCPVDGVTVEAPDEMVFPHEDEELSP